MTGLNPYLIEQKASLFHSILVTQLLQLFLETSSYFERTQKHEVLLSLLQRYQSIPHIYLFSKLYIVRKRALIYYESYDSVCSEHVREAEMKNTRKTLVLAYAR